MSAERITAESSPLHSALANIVSDAISKALDFGLEPDQAACVVVAVAADYARAEYGPDYLNRLAKVVLLRAADALPEDANAVRTGEA